MIFTSTDIASLLLAHVYEVLLPLSVFEGPIVTITGGFLVATGHLQFLPVFAIVVLGDVIGDALFYAFGRFVGARMLTTWAGPTSLEKARGLERRFRRKADQTLVIGKLTHTIGAMVLIVAGMVKLPFPRFMTVNFLATLPKSLVLLVIGYAVGSGYNLVPQHLSYLYFALLGVGVLAIYVVTR